jgi:hypothetical protein
MEYLNMKKSKLELKLESILDEKISEKDAFKYTIVSSIKNELQKEAAGGFGADVLGYEDPEIDDPEWIISQLKVFLNDSESFWSNMTGVLGESFARPTAKAKLLTKFLGTIKNVYPELPMFTKEEQITLGRRVSNLRERMKEDVEREERIERLKREDELQEAPAVETEPRPPLPLKEDVREEPAEEVIPPEEAEQLPEIDEKMFATKKQISDIYDLFLQSLEDEEITKDQLAMRMREFAKKHNLSIKLSKTASGKTQIKISKKDWEKIGKKAGWMGIKSELELEDDDASTTGEAIGTPESPESPERVHPNHTKHPAYDDDVIEAMEEIQKFIKENGIEAFRELAKKYKKLDLMDFRLVENPEGWE